MYDYPEDDGFNVIRLYIAFIVCIIFLWMLFGCSTKRSTESSIEVHRMQLMTERMDSMLHATSTWQKSIYTQQQSLVDSFKNSEVRDTSHLVFLSEKGDTVKEIIRIKEITEREHTSSESKETYFEERFRQTDSLLQVSLAKQEKMDSTLQAYQKTTVVTQEAPWYERLWNILKYVLLGVVLGVLLMVARKMNKIF